LKGEVSFLHFFEPKHRNIKAFSLFLHCSNFHQPAFFRLPHFLNSLSIQLLFVAILRLVFPLIFVIAASQFKYPLWVDLAAVVNEVRVAFDDLVVDYPLRIHNWQDRGGMDCEFFFGADVQIAAVSLQLRKIGEVASQDASQYCLLLIRWGLYLVHFMLWLAEFMLHLFLGVLESVESFELGHQLIINANCLFHYRETKLVFSANTFTLIHVSMVKPKEIVDQSQKVTLLCTYFLLGFKNSQSLTCEYLALHL